MSLVEKSNPLKTLDTCENILEISLHIMVGAVNPKIMKVLTKVENYPLVVLINISKSTDNFLNLNVMHKIQLNCNSKQLVRVKVVNGALVGSEGKIS